MNENKTNPTKFWKTIKTLFPDQRSSTKIRMNDLNGDPIHDDDLPNFINQFFSSIGTKLSSDNPFEHENYTFLGTEYQQVFQLQTVNEEQVLLEIKRLKNSKSSAIPDISTKVCKDAFIILITPFTYILNLSISSGSFPNVWKKAQVTPIPKDGSPFDINNYRPISLLPIPSKILEHLIHGQVEKYLDNIKFYTEAQGGFRKEHSTTATTTEFLDDIYYNINIQKLTRAVFVDFRKAFDSINHDLLFLKLKYAGFSEGSIVWFKSYLSDRQQTVKANNTESQSEPVTCGIPQGSILGPQLFLIFINDMTNVFKWSKYKLYADDTVFYTSGTDENDLLACQHIQQDLLSLSDWCKKNAITINTKKTKSMTFCTWYTLGDAVDLNLVLNDSSIENVGSYKYLGTILDERLNFEKQANETIRLVNHKLHCLSKIKQFISSEHCIQLYKTYI